MEGDVVFLVGKRRNTTVAVVMTDPELDVSKIAMSRGTRNNLRVRTADTVIVRPAPDIPN